MMVADNLVKNSPAREGRSSPRAPATATNTEGGATTTNKDDKVIGLQFTNGTTFYFYCSTLVKKSGYFAKRFNNDVEIDASDSITLVELGRPVYFFERDGTLFETYILPYILTDQPGTLPPYCQDEALWRSLRREAEFFQLDGMTKLLYVTRVCSPTNALGHGVLYYIGTNYGHCSHWNPRALGTVQVCRETQYMPSSTANDDNATDTAMMVQYHPTTCNVTSDPRWLAVIGMATRPEAVKSQDCCPLFGPPWCHQNNDKTKQVPTIIDLRSIKLRLVAYSLHKDACGMKYWTMEGSDDGKEWKELYTLRAGEEQLPSFTQKEKDMIKSEISMVKNDIMTVPAEPDPMQKVEIVLDQAENSRRKIWEIMNPMTDFFRFFRIIAIDKEDATTEKSSFVEDDADDTHSPIMTKRAFHELGIELFGEIHEE